MKIEVCVPETWTTVNLDWSEISEAIRIAMEDEPESVESTKRIIARYYGFLRAVPDEYISDVLSEKDREIISNALREQADRFAG